MRKSTKGIPRVTDKVLAMSDEEQAAWLAEKGASLTADQKAEVLARIETAKTEGRKPKKVDFGSIFKGRSVADLTDAKGHLTNALAAAAVEEEENLDRIIAKAELQKAALVSAREAKDAENAVEA